jgi:ribonuclease HI
MLTYGSTVWGHAVEKATIKHKLRKLQRLGLTTITFVRKGTPAAGMEVIYYLLPLHLRIIEKALGTFLRLGNLQRIAWTSNYPTQQGHIRWLQDRLPELIDDNEIAPVANLSPPFTVLIDHELKPREENICIYTDGSLMNVQLGAGIYIVDNGTPHLSMSERLPPCTVFQAELRGIQMACEHIRLNDHTRTPIHFHVDSQAALQSLVKSHITNKTVEYSVQLLTELALRREVTQQWVKAHVNIPGNELADEAAKAGGRSVRVTQAEIHNSRRNIKNFIKTLQNLEWKRESINQSNLFKRFNTVCMDMSVI